MAAGCGDGRGQPISVSDVLRADRVTQSDEHQRPNPAAQSENTSPPLPLSPSVSILSYIQPSYVNHDFKSSRLPLLVSAPPVLSQFHEDSKRSAANYISQHALAVKSVYVRAVATYALTLHDPNSMAASELFSSLEKVVRQKGLFVTIEVQIILS